MFDVAQRENISGYSVKELTTKLQQFQPNAIVCCCGADTMYLHVEQDGTAICLDVEALEDSYPESPAVNTDTKWAEKVYVGSLFDKARILLTRWEDQLRERYVGFCRRIARNWNKDHATYREFILWAQIQQTKDNVEFLQGELKAARKSNGDLQRKLQTLKDSFAEVLEMPDGALRQHLRFDVRRATDSSEWEVITEHCCLGGCDMGIYAFPQERDALIFATLLSVIGYKPSHNMACSACYAEHMKDCI